MSPKTETVPSTATHLDKTVAEIHPSSSTFPDGYSGSIPAHILAARQEYAEELRQSQASASHNVAAVALTNEVKAWYFGDEPFDESDLDGGTINAPVVRYTDPGYAAFVADQSARAKRWPWAFSGVQKR